MANERELLQGRELVAVQTGGVGEPGGQLVLPTLLAPAPGRGVQKGLERCGRAGHVGRCAEDDGVSLVDLAPALLVILDGNEVDRRAGDGRGTIPNGLGLHSGVAESAVVDDRDGGHDGLSLGAFSGTSATVREPNA